ncbi:MAG: SWIM zinc finger family protein, partial [Planctomycetota bacterium]|nr:SWIM zinc finger family protein [Planctomycetota bacterium]
MTKSRYKKTPATGSIASRVRQLFDPAVRGRGLSYFESGAVRILRSAATSVRASVQGRRRHLVEIDWGGKEFLCQCGCPYFADTGPCKHLWATLLAVEARDAAADPFVPQMPGARVLAVEDEDDDFDEDYAPPPPPPPPPVPARWKPARGIKLSWKDQLDELHQSWRMTRQYQGPPWSVQDELVYVIDVAGTLRAEQMILETCIRRRTSEGQWGVPRPFPLSPEGIASLPTAEDRRAAALLLGATANHSYHGGRSSSSFGLPAALRDLILPELCRTGRCWLRGLGPQSLAQLSLDEGPAWQFRLDVRRDDLGDHYVLRGSLRRDEARVDLARPAMLVAGGWVFWPETLARLDDMGAFDWVSLL